ncbi:NAD(P)H-hydrate dehydratase [Candidatus Solincola sp.]
MIRVLFPQEMAELDRAAEGEGIPSRELMERAGRAVAEQARDMLGGLCAGRRVVVAAAKGNNGGDGLVAARYLASWGARVEVFLLARPEELSPDAALNYRRYREQGGRVRTGEPALLEEMLHEADLVIDALFGFGFRGRAEGPFAKAIEILNRSGVPVLSVDLPSGVDASTGAVEGPAVEAKRTVTLAWPKVGLYLYPAAEKVGELVVADIGIPVHLLRALVKSDLYALEEEDATDMLPRRPPHAHKGMCGRVLVVAGSTGLTGAAALCARAAMRSGAGVVTLGIPYSLNPIMEVKLTEVMTLPLPDDGEGHLAEEAARVVLEALPSFDVLALGPGLGTSPGTVSAVRRLVSEAPRPLVLDADGLNGVVGQPSVLEEREGPAVITPHPGELGRLLGRSGAEVQRDRLGSAREAARRFGCPVVLKGANTVIAEPGGRACFHPLALPELATAGSGDVLTGCLAALLAQGLSPMDAALCAVVVHGKAARLASSVVGGVGMVAGDVISHLPLALAGLGKR